MGSGISQSSVFDRYPRTGDAAKQWYLVRNLEDKVIPPFAIMQLARKDAKGAEDLFVGQSLSGDDIAWHVQQCDDYGEAFASSSIFVFNGRLQIAKKGFGRATFCYPVQCRHDGRTDGLPSFRECGAKAGSWSIHSGGRGFRCLSHDVARPYEEADGGIHTVWLNPSYAQPVCYGRNSGAVATPVPAQDFLSFGLWRDPTILGKRKYQNSVNVEEDTSQGKPAWKVRLSGRFLVSISATIWCTDTTTRGSRLALSIWVWRSATEEWEQTNFEAVRYQAVEESGYAVIKGVEMENVATTAVVILEAGDEIAIQNDSDVALSIEAPRLTIERLGGLDDAQDLDHKGLAWP